MCTESKKEYSFLMIIISTLSQKQISSSNAFQLSKLLAGSAKRAFQLIFSLCRHLVDTDQRMAIRI
jgi:hypothetical protein